MQWKTTARLLKSLAGMDDQRPNAPFKHLHSRKYLTKGESPANWDRTGRASRPRRSGRRKPQSVSALRSVAGSSSAPGPACGRVQQLLADDIGLGVVDRVDGDQAARRGNTRPRRCPRAGRGERGFRHSRAQKPAICSLTSYWSDQNQGSGHVRLDFRRQ